MTRRVRRHYCPTWGISVDKKTFKQKKLKKLQSITYEETLADHPGAEKKEADNIFNFIQRIAYTLQRRLYKNTNRRECRLLGDGQAGPGMVKYLNAAAAD